MYALLEFPFNIRALVYFLSKKEHQGWVKTTRSHILWNLINSQPSAAGPWESKLPQCLLSRSIPSYHSVEEQLNIFQII